MESNMENKKAGPDRPTPAAEKADFVETITEIYTRGIERLAEVEKKGLEIAVLHNAEVASAWKKLTLGVPALSMFDLTTSAFERFAETQKSAIDLVLEQTHAFAKKVKERDLKAFDTVEEGKHRAKEAIEHSVAAQKTVLDYTAKQTKAVLETTKQQLGYSGTPAGVAADSMQRGVEVAVEAQKKLLDELVAVSLH
jgi:hypothetical protein